MSATTPNCPFRHADEDMRREGRRDAHDTHSRSVSKRGNGTYVRRRRAVAAAPAAAASAAPAQNSKATSHPTGQLPARWEEENIPIVQIRYDSGDR